MDAKLLFKYRAQDDDELNVEADEVVKVKRKRDDGWWLVRRAGGQEGVIPGNYCQMLHGERESRDYLCRPEELPSGNNPGSEDEAEAGTVPAAPAAATAMGTFRAANGAELSVREGETVAVLGKDEGGWTLCAARGMQGLVPTSYLKAAADGAEPTASPTQGCCPEQGGAAAKQGRDGGSLFGRLVGSKPASTAAPPPPTSPRPTTHVMYGSHAYHAQTGGQVSLEAGEAVETCVSEESEGWTRVHTRGGASGLVPSTCLCVVPPVTPGGSSRDTATPRSAVTTVTPGGVGSGRRRGGPNLARAIAPFPGGGSGEVALDDGDEVQVLESRANGWTLVRSLSSGREGLAPSSFLDPPPPAPVRTDSKKATKGVASSHRGNPGAGKQAPSKAEPAGEGAAGAAGQGRAAAAAADTSPKARRSGPVVARSALKLAEGASCSMVAPHTSTDGAFSVEEGEGVRVLLARADGWLDVTTASGQRGSVPAAFVEGRAAAEGTAAQDADEPSTPMSAVPAPSPAAPNGLLTPSPVVRRSANPVARELGAQWTPQAVPATEPSPSVQKVAPQPRHAPVLGPEAGKDPQCADDGSGVEPPGAYAEAGGAGPAASDPPGTASSDAPTEDAGVPRGVAALRARFER